MSTMIFSDYAKHQMGELNSCDISLKNINSAKKFTEANNEFINFFRDDSLNFLNNISKL